MMRLVSPRAAVAFVMVAVLLQGGCTRMVRRPQPRPTPPQNTSPVAPPPPASATPPPPSELDLAMEAATKARSDGDRAGAVQVYEKAASLAQDGGRRAEILFTIGLMYADPAFEARDLERSRTELLRAASEAPEGPRAAEASLLASLIDELIVLRAQSAELKIQSEAARAEISALKSRLDEKEKELAEIKKILLQDKGKP